MKHLRFCYLFAIPFFLTLPLGYGHAEQSPSWAPPAEQPSSHSSYDFPHQNVLEIPSIQQETAIPQTQDSSDSYPEDSSLQASFPDDPWYRHQASNFDDPYYQRQREREQRVGVTPRGTYRPPQQNYASTDWGNQYNGYDDGQTRVTSTTQLPRTYPSTVSRSQAPSALWDVAHVMGYVAGISTGLLRYDRCSRQFRFAGVPLR